MTGAYVGNACFPFSRPEGDQLVPYCSESQEYCLADNIPMVDASAYVSEISAIPDGTAFLFSRLWEKCNVMALDYPTKRDMNDALGRMAEFVETNHKLELPRRVPDTGAAHDLKLSDIADFFNMARRDATFALTKGEQALEKALLEKGLLYSKAGETVAMPNRAIIALSRGRDPEYRRRAFVHEYSHALYFVNPSFADSVDRAWSSFTTSEQRFFTSALTCTGSYSDMGWLHHTEMQAYFTNAPSSKWGFSIVLQYADAACRSGARMECCHEITSFAHRDELIEKAYRTYMDLSRPFIPLLE